MVSVDGLHMNMSCIRVLRRELQRPVSQESRNVDILARKIRQCVGVTPLI